MMQEIQGKTRSVRELLSGAKYGIDYYQREYKWQTKQMAELVSDLTGAFLEDYQEAHQRADVANYGHYFLGSIVISQRDNERLIVDGQQRMTSLTLLLLPVPAKYAPHFKASKEMLDRLKVEPTA